MHLNLAGSAAFLHAAIPLAQTLPVSLPTTENRLGVTYGSKEVTPGIMLAQSETSTIPTFNFRPPSLEQAYTLVLVDLSISSTLVDPSKLNPAQRPLAPGIGNRTTRLHFWQAGLAFSGDGMLVNKTEPIAYYVGPMPPPRDIPHDYVFYLFEQEEGFLPPPGDNPFNVKNVDASPMNRLSFNVQRLAEEEGVGDLVGTNYFKVQNRTGSGNSTGVSSAGGGATASAIGTVTTPSASPVTGATEDQGWKAHCCGSF